MSHDSISFPARCTHCQAQMHSQVICDACNSLQPVEEDADFFDLLGLAAAYRLDSDALTAAFLRVSRSVHPDYFGHSADNERGLAEDLSARINDAYRTLRDPLTRSEYLLRRAGGKSATDDKRVPPRLLGEVMMIREQIEDARRSNNAAELSQIHRQLEMRVSEMFEELKRLHEKLESSDPAPETLNQLRLTLNGVRYLQNLVNESAA